MPEATKQPYLGERIGPPKSLEQFLNEQPSQEGMLTPNAGTSKKARVVVLAGRKCIRKVVK